MNSKYQYDIELMLCAIYLAVFVAGNAWAFFRIFDGSANNQESKNKAWLFLIWELPLVYLIDPNALLRGDYIAHAGQAAAMASMIKNGDAWPNVTNTLQIIGDMTPSLSGRFNLLLEGYLSIILGAHMAVRAVIFMATALQVWFTFLAVRIYGQPVTNQLMLTAIAYWTTYNANNIYNRGAVAETIATALASTSMCLLILWWNENGKDRQKFYFSLLLLCVGGFILTHPITGVFGSFVLLVVSGVFIVKNGHAVERYKSHLLFGTLSLILICPWLYLNIKYPPTNSAIGMSFELVRFTGLDEFLLRILPFPLSRMPKQYGHPYFLTQINSILFLLAIFFLAYLDPVSKEISARKQWHYSVFILSLATLLLCISTNSFLDEYLPVFVLASQFAYRLVSPINSLIFFAVLLAIPCATAAVMSKRTRCVMIIAFAGALAGVIVNLYIVKEEIKFTNLQRSDGILSRKLEVAAPFLHIYPVGSDAWSFEQSNGCSFSQMKNGPKNIQCNARDWADIVFDPTNGSALFNPKKEAQRISSAKTYFDTNLIFHPYNRLIYGGENVSCEGYLYFCRFKNQINNFDIQLLKSETRFDTNYLILDKISICGFLLLAVATLYFKIKLRKQVQVVGSSS